MKTILSLCAIIIGLILTNPVLAQTVPLTVDSDPQGAKFSLEVPNNKFSITGTTPARINNVPTGKAIVHFENLPNCLAPKPQNRVIDSTEQINFFGRYACGNSSSEPTVTVLPPVASAKRVSIRLSPHQLEFLPGGAVNFTVAIHNDAEAITSPITVLVQFNESELTPNGALALGGVYQEGGQIAWTIPALQFKETWSTTVPLRVANSVNTDSLHVQASVQGAGFARASASATIGTPTLPETGFGFDTIFLALSAAISAGFVWKRKLA